LLAHGCRPVQAILFAFLVVFFDALRVKIRDEGGSRTNPSSWRWGCAPTA
jgi:hypothetical protein